MTQNMCWQWNVRDQANPKTVYLLFCQCLTKKTPKKQNKQHFQSSVINLSLNQWEGIIKTMPKQDKNSGNIDMKT